MLCENPFMVGVMPCGCGQCPPCRVNRRRLWSHRILLESFMHDASSFATLTYAQENNPQELCPKDAQLFLKRLRRSLSPRKIRFFLVGEYGDKTWRPHYHAALFGVHPLEEKVVRDAWGLGHTLLGELNEKTASYVSGYVTKKYTKKDNPCLMGKHPEFARMSLRPGIAATAMNVVSQSMSTLAPNVVLPDVTSVLQHGKSKWPLGRYLMRKLREEIGRSPDTPDASKQIFAAECRQRMATLIAENKSQKILDIEAQQIQNLKARHKIYTPTRGL